MPIFWKVNTGHQMRKPINECDYYSLSVSFLARDISKTRNMFRGTWYLPHSRDHYDRQCHFSMRMCETVLFLLPVMTVGTVKTANLRHLFIYLSFVAIGQTVAEIWRFFDFSKMAAPAILNC